MTTVEEAHRELQAEMKHAGLALGAAFTDLAASVNELGQVLRHLNIEHGEKEADNV